MIYAYIHVKYSLSNKKVYYYDYFVLRALSLHAAVLPGHRLLRHVRSLGGGHEPDRCGDHRGGSLLFVRVHVYYVFATI